MKSIISATIFCCSISPSVNAQKAPDTLSPLLSWYYNIKDALVKSDATTAAASATEFVKAIHAIDMKALSEAEHKAFMDVDEKLTVDAGHITETSDIDQQRKYFKTFSYNFSVLAKGVKLSDQPIYEAYCPMKKAGWLSSSTAIKNPYYGKAMLTCGKVTATL